MHSFVIQTLIQTFAAHKLLGFFLVFAGLLIEGEFVLFIAAFLTEQRIFNAGYMLIIVICGVLLGDILWYFAGRRLNGTGYWWQKWFDHIAKPFDRHLVKNPFRTIFISKFTYGFHRAILLRVGELRIEFGRFLKADIASAVIWIGIIGALGYKASASFLILRHYLRLAEAGLVIGLIGFFLFLHFVSHLLQREL
jgi:membrane protein DedA with SNARE-associated domain